MQEASPSLDQVKNVSSVEDAVEIQAKIEPLVHIPGDNDQSDSFNNIIALDVAYSTSSDLIVASGVLYRIRESRSDSDEIIAEKVISGIARFPYIPGLLAFREIPILASVIEALLPSIIKSGKGNKMEEKEKTALLCDGAGIAHPRLCGIASHLGVLYNLPSIGVAKNHLTGTTFDENEEGGIILESKRGSYSSLYVKGKEVGSVLRSQDEIRPIFVSPGHLISIKEARDTVLFFCQKYRLPEPIRRADQIGRLELKRMEDNIKREELIAKPKSTSSFIHRQQENNNQRNYS